MALIIDLLFTFFSRQGKTQKFLQHISQLHTYIYFAHPVDFLCLPNFANNIAWHHFGMTPGVDSSLCHFGVININYKMVSKILVGMSTTDIYLH